jgi:hypothetical protein
MDLKYAGNYEAVVVTDKSNDRQYVAHHKGFTDRPITSPGGGIVTSGAGEAVVEERRRHASRRENSTLAISVATHSGRSGIAHIIMNRSDNIMCCKRHKKCISDKLHFPTCNTNCNISEQGSA